MKALIRSNPAVFTLTSSLFLVVGYNYIFWNRLIEATGGFRMENLPLYIGIFVVLLLAFNVLLTLVTFKPLIKPVLIALFCTTSMAVYFMSHYGIAIDTTMMQNVLETDPREASELLSWRMLPFFGLLGILPSYLVWRAPLKFPSLRRDLLIRAGIISVSLVLIGALLLVLYKQVAPTFRQHRELGFLLTPVNYLNATNRYLSRRLAKARVMAPLGTDAVKGASWQEQKRKVVTVIVLGETARAMNFSLNGYTRNTNPELSKQAGLINFSNMHSCGTATATSLPCMFSNLGRNNYSDDKAKSQQGLLDVISHAGLNVLWRNNNSGCKGACDRVEYEDMAKPVAGNPFCNAQECVDERMLEKLPEKISASDKDMVIVLHQLGSHGPAYWKRYPEKFKRFKPVCETVDLQKCTTEEIVAAYDNTILYTDHFVSETINLLRKLEKEQQLDVALIYLSDHGESLGENGMYLHGAPYMIAPIEQRQVPFVMWLSDSYQSRFKIDTACVAARASQEYSHDHLFHSVLGMLDIKTSVRKPELDVFQLCRRAS